MSRSSSFAAAVELAERAVEPGPTALDLVRADALREASGAATAIRWPRPGGDLGLDALLPLGLPRGRVTEWAGPRSAGKTTALRALVHAVRAAGDGAAYVDGAGTLAPASWAPEAGMPPFWVVRPPAAEDVLAAAEELLRSGAFGLVIAEVEGGTGWRPSRVVRLQRLARASGAALVAVVDRPGRVPVAGLRVEFRVAGPALRRVRVRPHGLFHEMTYVQSLPYRLPVDSGLPDRRAPAR